MPYRSKNAEPFAEFTIRDRGISEYPDLTIEIETSFSEDFNAKLKTALRHGSERAWDPANSRWRIHPRAKEKVVALAKDCFPNLYQVEGDTITDLITGHQVENRRLF